MIKVILGFIQKELKQTLRDKRMRALIFVAPVMQMTVFGLALSTETRNVRLAIADSAADPLLDNIRQHALASGWFLRSGRDGSGDPFALIRSNAADAVLIPPAGGLSRASTRGGSELQVLIDGSDAVRAVGINRYLAAIVESSVKNGAGQVASGSALPSLGFDIRILYNPTLRSAVYLVPGVMSVISCLITILLTSMSIAREREVGTFEAIIAAPVRSIEIVLGKTIPYVLLGMVNIPLILAVAVFVFNVPMRGPLMLLLAASFVFICATVAIGTLISTITKTQQQAMMGGFIYIMPSLMTSGLLSPVQSMPLALQVMAYSNPITYYMELLRNIMLKGGDMQLALQNMSVMTIMAIILAGLSIHRFKTTL